MCNAIARAIRGFRVIQPRWEIHNEILPIHDVHVRIRLDQKPSAVTQQPAGKKLPFTWSNGVCTLQIPKIDLHEIIQIRPAR
jgi:hypothetical protein